MKTFIGTNILTSVESIAYANHIQFYYRLGKNHPNDTFAINTPRRMSIDNMRNMTAKLAIESNFDYLMFIDDDVIVPVNAFDALLEADADIAAGWTIVRGHPYPNMFYRYTPDGKRNLETVKNVERNSGVIDVDAVGFSCVLIKVDLLKKTPPPWFVTGPYNTEDIYFCVKAKKYNPDCKIVVNTNVETAHILGPEFIAPWNRDDYKSYVEKQEPGLIAKKDELTGPSGDRGEKYLQMVKHDDLPKVIHG